MTKKPSPAKLYFRLFLAVLSWACLIFFIFTVPPDSFQSKIAFFFVLFLCLFLTASLLIPKLKLDLLISFYFVVIAIFHFVGQINILNITLLSGLTLILFFLIPTS